MLSTGITRKVDQLGRVSIPIELRSELGLETGSSVEYLSEGNTVVLKAFSSGCMFCGEIDYLTSFKEKLICKACKNSLLEQL